MSSSSSPTNTSLNSNSSMAPAVTTTNATVTTTMSVPITSLAVTKISAIGVPSPNMTITAAEIQFDQETLASLLETLARRISLTPPALATASAVGTTPYGIGNSVQTMSASAVIHPSRMMGTQAPNSFATATLIVLTITAIHPMRIMGTSVPTLSAPLHSSRIISTAEKPPKFSGEGFKRWQQKMLFYLTMIVIHPS